MPLSGILLSFDGILLRMKESNEKEECLMCQLQQLPHREGIHLQLKSVVSRDLARVFNSHIQISRSPLGYISCLTDYLSSLFWLRTLTANYCYVVQWNRGGVDVSGWSSEPSPLIVHALKPRPEAGLLTWRVSYSCRCDGPGMGVKPYYLS